MSAFSDIDFEKLKNDPLWVELEATKKENEKLKKENERLEALKNLFKKRNRMMINTENIMNKRAKLFLRLSIGFFISSFIAGFVAAYLGDFHPKLGSFQFLASIKAIFGTIASFVFFVAHCENRD